MNVLLVSHKTDLNGPVQSIARFIRSTKPDHYYEIQHPLVGNQPSQFWHNNELQVQKKCRLAGFFRYLYDFQLSFQWIRSIEKPLDFAIGMNCFDTARLLFFRQKKIKKIIFFNTDYSRQRFENSWLNAIYVFVDKFVAQRCDQLCCVTNRAKQARIKEGIKAEKIQVIPNGVFLEDIGFLAKNSEFNRKLLFIGSLTKEHGLDQIIACIKDTSLVLEIIGQGHAEKELHALVKTLNLNNQVRFLGFRSHEQVMAYMKSFNGIGVAPYQQHSDWVNYCDPVKVKEYLACQVPVLISTVPEIAGQIKEQQLGFVFDTATELALMIKQIDQLSSEEYQQLVKNIQSHPDQYDLNSYYPKLFI